jgi:hypothetical protein
MAKTSANSDRKSGQKTEADRRAERLRAALRENLKRRKVQSKGRAAEAPEVDVPADESPHDPVTPKTARFAGDKTPG